MLLGYSVVKVCADSKGFQGLHFDLLQEIKAAVLREDGCCFQQRAAVQFA